MRKTRKKVLPLLLVLVMCLVLAAPAFAAGADGLTKLANPTELKWDATRPGVCTWKTEGHSQNSFFIQFYRDGSNRPVWDSTHDFGADYDSSEYDIPWFAVNCAGEDYGAWESGDYYFTVQNRGDEIEYSDSDVISSKDLEGGIYHYVRPDAVLPTIEQGSWNWPAMVWTEPSDKGNIGGYWIEYGFSETPIDPNSGVSDELTIIGGSSGVGPGNADLWLQEELVSENGNGYYYFRVRALSSNINTIQNSPYSPWSDAYNLASASKEITDRLTELNSSTTEANVKEKVQKLNQVELENAMRADLDGTNGTIDALSALEQKVGGPAAVSVSNGMTVFAPADISVVGAKLNNASGSGDITLNVGPAQSNHHIRDELYNSTVAVDFSMTLDNAGDTSRLAVPVKVTLPIPSTINPEFLVILHYHTDGSYEEVHTHCFKNNGKWFASFVLTSFSDFVMTQRSDAEPTQPDDPDPSTPVGPGSDNSSSYSPSNPTYTVTNGRGSAANGSWSSDKPTAKKGDTVTITAKPDEGYAVDTVTVRNTSGGDVTIKDLGTNKYSFTMPGGRVTVSITFVPAEPVQPTLPTVESIPAAGTAVARTQTVQLDGKDVTFQCYAVKNAQGNETNYVKLRDLAMALNGTKAQFNVGWDGKISIIPSTAYEAVGTENSTPYSGDQPYKAVSGEAVNFNGSSVNLTSFQLKDSAGNGYTYYKLRDLGQLLNFNVTWNGSSIVVESDQPYTG